MTIAEALKDDTKTPPAAPAPTDAEKAAVARGDVLNDEQVAAEVPANAGADAAAEEAEAAKAIMDKAESEAARGDTPVDETIETARDPKTGQFTKKEEPAAEVETEGIMIPKARFDAAQKKSKETIDKLNAELEATRQRYATPEGVTAESIEKLIDDKESERTNLLADGELDKATAVAKEINRLNRQLAALEFAPKALERDSAVVGKNALDSLIEEFEAAFPTLNYKHASHNEEQVKFVADRMGRYEASGMSSAEALIDAVEDAVYRFGLVRGDEPAPSAEKPAKPAAPSKPAQTQAKMDLAKKHPASLSAVGLDSDAAGLAKPNVKDMSQEDFAKLPESTKKRLRGDEF